MAAVATTLGLVAGGWVGVAVGVAVGLAAPILVERLLSLDAARMADPTDGHVAPAANPTVTGGAGDPLADPAARPARDSLT